MTLRLQELHAKTQAIVNDVIDGHLPGALIAGPGGLGKTHCVMEVLDRRGLKVSPLNTRATGFGLYRELYERRQDPVVLIEDLESLYTDLDSLSLLRSLLWGRRLADGSMERVASWTSQAADGEEIPKSYRFESRIIMTANRVPKRNVVFDSLVTRLAFVRFEVSDRAVFSFMRDLVQDGDVVFDQRTNEAITLKAEECLEVVGYLEGRGVSDLRMLRHALALFHAHRDGTWRELLDLIIGSGASEEARTPEESRNAEPGKGRPGRRRRTAGKVLADREVIESLRETGLPTSQILEVFQRKTGKSRAVFFRRLRELKNDSGG